MKALIIIIQFFATVAFASTKVPSDSQIATELVGTWIDVPSEHAPMHGKATYNSDGYGFEYVWPAGQPESSAVRIDTTWFVTNQVLVIKSVGSSDARKVPVGIELWDRILSISADQYEFDTESGYGDADKQRHTRVRVKNGP